MLGEFCFTMIGRADIEGSNLPWGEIPMHSYNVRDQQQSKMSSKISNFRISLRFEDLLIFKISLRFHFRISLRFQDLFTL